MALLSLFTLAVIGSCSHPDKMQWDSRLAEHFSLDEQGQEDNENLLQSVNVTGEFEGVTMHIGQTIGDGHILHISLDVTFPDRINLSDFIPQSGAPVKSYPSLEGLQLRKGSPDGTKGFSSSTPGASGYYTFLSCQSLTADPASNKVSYLLSFADDQFSLAGQEVTLLFEKIILDTGHETLVVANGPQWLTWKTGDCNQVRQLTVKDDSGTPVGSVAVSPIGLWVKLAQSDFASQEEFDSTVAVYRKDGTQWYFSGDHGGSYDKETGYCQAHWTFAVFLNLDDVGKIQVGPYQVEL